MALWKETTPGSGSASPGPGVPGSPPAREPERTNVAPLSPDAPRRAAAPRQEMKESFLSADLTIEGKIVGSGHVRIAGRFKGDVQVDGNLTIESGANLDGQVRAQVVTVAGELKGNIDNAKRVELLEGGIIQ